MTAGESSSIVTERLELGDTAPPKVARTSASKSLFYKLRQPIQRLVSRFKALTEIADRELVELPPEQREMMKMRNRQQD